MSCAIGLGAPDLVRPGRYEQKLYCRCPSCLHCLPPRALKGFKLCNGASQIEASHAPETLVVLLSVDLLAFTRLKIMILKCSHPTLVTLC